MEKIMFPILKQLTLDYRKLNNSWLKFLNGENKMADGTTWFDSFVFSFAIDSVINEIQLEIGDGYPMEGIQAALGSLNDQLTENIKIYKENKIVFESFDFEQAYLERKLRFTNEIDLNNKLLLSINKSSKGYDLEVESIEGEIEDLESKISYAGLYRKNTFKIMQGTTNRILKEVMHYRNSGRRKTQNKIQQSEEAKDMKPAQLIDIWMIHLPKKEKLAHYDTIIKKMEGLRIDGKPFVKNINDRPVAQFMNNHKILWRAFLYVAEDKNWIILKSGPKLQAILKNTFDLDILPSELKPGKIQAMRNRPDYINNFIEW